MHLTNVDWRRVFGAAAVGIGCFLVVGTVTGGSHNALVPVALLAAGIVGALPRDDTDALYEAGWTAALIAFGALVALPAGSLPVGWVDADYTSYVIAWVVVSAIVFVPLFGIGGVAAGYVGHRIAN